MTAPKLPDDTSWGGDQTRGASLGRVNRGAPSDAAAKFYLQRVRLDSGGYDQGGTYWGIGEPLYWASTDNSETERFFRAPDRATAKEHVRTTFPGARFYN